MEEWGVIGRMLILLGAVMALVGVLFLVAPRVPYLGKLPGDILVRKGNFTFYFPLTTCIIVSVLLTLFFFLVKR